MFALMLSLEPVLMLTLMSLLILLLVLLWMSMWDADADAYARPPTGAHFDQKAGPKGEPIASGPPCMLVNLELLLWMHLCVCVSTQIHVVGVEQVSMYTLMPEQVFMWMRMLMWTSFFSGCSGCGVEVFRDVSVDLLCSIFC